MKQILVFVALLAGAFMPVQAGINARLRLTLGTPEQAALVSFAVGTLALAVYALVLRLPWPPASEVSQAPWWSWTGGVLGAFFVAVTVMLAPRLGAATMMAWIIAGQLAASIFLDQYGLVGYAVREASPLRLLGAVLLVAGAVLVQRY
ncbi:DMT family transporter [Desulfovibrio aminophilus]|nr:DMT family transporter [Desulfovibrio aminophilus]MCM0755664.1 DMT family transporter [Desulfovibrio aminophilus]